MLSDEKRNNNLKIQFLEEEEGDVSLESSPNCKNFSQIRNYKDLQSKTIFSNLITPNVTQWAKNTKIVL